MLNWTNDHKEELIGSLLKHKASRACICIKKMEEINSGILSRTIIISLVCFFFLNLSHEKFI